MFVREPENEVIVLFVDAYGVSFFGRVGNITDYMT